MSVIFSGKVRCVKFMNSVLVLLFLLLISVSLNASNKIVVATIGGSAPAIDKTKDMQTAVENVIKFWDNRLKQVLPDKPDLIVLPEVCDRPDGISRDEQLEFYRVRKNQILNFFSSVAKENQCYIVFGSKHEEEGVGWRNTSFLLDRQGLVAGTYDKYFPTIYEIEAGVVPGNKAPVFECDFGTVACAICFDLNFDELLYKYADKKPDIILFSSVYHGGIMQDYWAYQCRSFFVGACGRRKIPSEIRNPLGEIMATSTNYFDYAVTTINLDSKLVHLDYNWRKLRALKEKYGRTVSITDPGRLGAVLLTSENDLVTAVDMINEFEIEMLDDYFSRSRTAVDQFK